MLHLPSRAAPIRKLSIVFTNIVDEEPASLHIDLFSDRGKDEIKALSRKLKSLRRHELISITYYNKDAYISKTETITDIDSTFKTLTIVRKLVLELNRGNAVLLLSIIFDLRKIDVKFI